MSLAVGTNCGFVLARPVDDPSATPAVIDSYARAFKVTSPVGAVHVSEIGWWCDNATEAADFDVGIYSHDAVNNRPLDQLAVATVAKGTVSGWKYGSIDLVIAESTVYWIAAQVDNTATATNYDYADLGGQKQDRKNSQSSLPSSWGTSDNTYSYTPSIYAVYDEGGEVIEAAGVSAAQSGTAAIAALLRKSAGSSAAVSSISSSTAKLLSKVSGISDGLSAALPSFAKVFRKAAAVCAASSFAVATVGALSQIFFDDSMEWCRQDGSYLLVYCGRPQKSSRSSYSGPWRFAFYISGSTLSPVNSPHPVVIPYPVVPGQLYFFKFIILCADGRVSSPFFCNYLVP